MSNEWRFSDLYNALLADAACVDLSAGIIGSIRTKENMI